MHLECHATLGWMIGNCFSNDRRVRNYATIGAVLPDIDAIPYLFGPYYYGLYHHTFGHNVFLWIAFSAFGVKRFGNWKAGLAGFVAFGSHLLTDAYLSNWLLYLFWPLSRKGFLPAHSLELSSPVNTWLLYTVPLQLLIAGLIWKRTPLEWISPRLDEIFVSFFRAKALRCTHCGKGANVRCDACGTPICPKHLVVKSGFRVFCPNCLPAAPGILPAREKEEPEQLGGQ